MTTPKRIVLGSIAAASILASGHLIKQSVYLDERYEVTKEGLNNCRKLIKFAILCKGGEAYWLGRLG